MEGKREKDSGFESSINNLEK